MPPRKQIGDKKAADGDVDCFLFIHTTVLGCKRHEVRGVKRKPWTTLTFPDQPSNPRTKCVVDVVDADLDLDFIKQQDEIFFGKGADAVDVPHDGKGTDADVEAKKKRKEPAHPCGSCHGKWHRHKGSGVDVGDGEEKGLFNKRKRHRKANKEKEPSGGEEKGVFNKKRKRRRKLANKEKEPSGGDEEDVDPCEVCNGRHKICPLRFELPRGPIPDVNPGWYVACLCCYGDKFEENTADCAMCGSSKKVVLQKGCLLCWGNDHFDNRDKECHVYREHFSESYLWCSDAEVDAVNAEVNAFNSKFFAKKQEELAAKEKGQ